MSTSATGFTVIYDGQCRMCRASIAWLQLRINLTAISFHEINCEKFGLTQDECAKEVIALQGSQVFRGADAVIQLLEARGKGVLALIFRAAGPFAHFGYKWIASHRNSLIARSITYLLERSL